jgi:hypothetical protein
VAFSGAETITNIGKLDLQAHIQIASCHKFLPTGMTHCLFHSHVGSNCAHNPVIQSANAVSSQWFPANFSMIIYLSNFPEIQFPIDRSEWNDAIKGWNGTIAPSPSTVSVTHRRKVLS